MRTTWLAFTAPVWRTTKKSSSRLLLWVELPDLKRLQNQSFRPRPTLPFRLIMSWIASGLFLKSPRMTMVLTPAFFLHSLIGAGVWELLGRESECQDA